MKAARLFDQFTNYLDTILPIASEFGKSDDCKKLKHILDLGGKNTLTLAVCGEFKRGKSSLVNAILKQNICPVADGIATAAVSVIKYGENPKAVRYFSIVREIDNSEQIAVECEQIDLSDITNYTGGSSMELDNTLYIEIELPIDILSKGLVIIDTPGIGSLDPRHLFLTRQTLPKADAIFFVSDTTEPMMTTELDFIKDCILPTHKPFVVILSKTDKITKDEMEAYRQEREDKIFGYCNIHIDCIPVSSTLWIDYNNTSNERKKIKSNCDTVKEAISSFYSKRQKYLEDLFRSEFLTLMSNIKNEIDKSLKHLSDDDDIKAAKEQYLKQLGELKALKKEIMDDDSGFRLKINSIIETSQEKVFSEFSKESVLLSTDKLDEILQTPETLQDKEGRYVIDRLNKEIQIIGTNIDRKIDSAIDDLVKEMAKYISSFDCGTSRFIGKIDGKVSYTSHSFSEKFMTITKSALPVFGVYSIGYYTVATLVSSTIAPVIGVAASFYYLLQAIKGANNHEKITTIRKQVTPRISMAVTELKSYIQKRYAQIQKELIRNLKTIAEKMENQMQEKMRLLTEIQNDARRRESARKELDGKIRLLNTVIAQVKVYDTNPFAKK